MKCFGVATTPAASIAPTNASAICDERYGSSPYVSSTRPQRTSLAMLITGESACRIPRLRVSRADAAATLPTSAVSQVAARPIACGNTIAPSRPSPCSASSNGMIGMPSRVRSTKYRWIALMRSACARAHRSARPRAHAAHGDLETERAARVVVRGVVEIAGNHERLPELLVERHAAEQIADAVGDGESCVAVRQRSRLLGVGPDPRLGCDEDRRARCARTIDNWQDALRSHEHSYRVHELFAI